MGPRRWGRGRPSVAASGGYPFPRLQWGRDDGVAEDGCGGNGYAAASGLQWGRDDGVAEDGTGTTPREAHHIRLQWGRDDGVAEDDPLAARPVPLDVASMGPRRWGRGRRAGSLSWRRPTWRFNGAATMGSRKTW